jgi:mannose-6-phosphate isomerase-like protein (cupin superfamily)
MRIKEVPANGSDGPLTIVRVVKPGKHRWVPEHVHLDFSEKFVIVRGIADAEILGSPQRLAAGRTLFVGPGRRHVNPTNSDITELEYEQSFIPGTEGARSYVTTLAQVLRDGRDEDGDLPWSLVLAIGDVTRERTYARPVAYAEGIQNTVQRRLLLRLGSYVAGTRGFDVQLARKPRKADVVKVLLAAQRGGKLGGAP